MLLAFYCYSSAVGILEARLALTSVAQVYSGPHILRLGPASACDAPVRHIYPIAEALISFPFDAYECLLYEDNGELNQRN
jgi:hypothetical protein